jgi:hypothetical protein
MIRVRYEQLSKGSFNQTWQKLMGMPMRTPGHFRLVHIAKIMQKEYEKMQTGFKERILSEYAVMKDGQPEHPSDKCMELKIPFLVKAGQENAAHEALVKYSQTEFCIDYKPLTVDELHSMGQFSAAEVLLLEPFLDQSSFEKLAEAPVEAPASLDNLRH